MKKLGTNAITFLLLAVLGLVGVVTYERSVSSHVNRILTSGKLPPSTHRTPAAPLLPRKLDELDDKLKALIAALGDSPDLNGRTSSGAPWQWLPEYENSLRAFSDAVAPILDEFARLLESNELQAILRDDQLYIGVDSSNMSLMRSRNWANAQASSAITSARRGDFEGAAERLGNAVDLVQLQDGGTAIDWMIGAAVNCIALEAMMLITLERPESAAILRDALRTGRIDFSRNSRASEIYWSAITFELEYYQKRRSGAEPYLERLGWTVDMHGRLDALESALEANLDLKSLSSKSQEDLRASMGFALEATDQQLRQRVELVRVVLAATIHREQTGAWPAALEELAPLFDGPVPIDPVAHRPFFYSASADSLNIALPDHAATANIDGPSTYTRYGYHWQRVDELQFNPEPLVEDSGE